MVGSHWEEDARGDSRLCARVTASPRDVLEVTREIINAVAGLLMGLSRMDPQRLTAGGHAFDAITLRCGKCNIKAIDRQSGEERPRRTDLKLSRR